MRKFKYLLPFLFLLSACQSAEEKKTEWIKSCIEGEFTPKQCNVLYSIVKNSDDNASDNSALTGVAIGLAAGRR